MEEELREQMRVRFLKAHDENMKYLIESKKELAKEHKESMKRFNKKMKKLIADIQKGNNKKTGKGKCIKEWERKRFYD